MSASRCSSSRVTGDVFSAGVDLGEFERMEEPFSDVVYGPLHDLVGGAIARELCLTGRSLSAAEALAIRLVTTVVPAGQAVPEARRVAGMITRAPREVLVRTKAKAVRRAGVTGSTLDL